MFGRKSSNEIPKRWIKYIDVVTNEVLKQQDLNRLGGVPLIPCIGSKVKHTGFTGVIVDVFLDYTSDNAVTECDAVIITVNVTIREDVKNEREDLFGFYYSLQAKT